MYESVVGGLADLLKNQPQGAVATKTEVMGLVGSTPTSTWRIIVKLV